MKATSRFLEISIRLVIILAVLFTGLSLKPAAPAAAYSGGFAIRFDGTNDAVRVGAPNSGQTMMGPDCKNTKSTTVWVRPLGTAPTTGTVLDADVIVGDGPNWFGIVRSIIGGQDRIWVYNVDIVSNVDRIGIPYTVGEWVHIALVHTGGRLKAYKNGVLAGDIASGTTNTSGPAIAGCTTMYFGGQGTGPTPYPNFEGDIDEVSYWGKELTVEEIRQIMNSGLVGNEASLGAYFKMTDGSGGTVTNNTGNATYNGTFVDDASVTPTPEWVASGALAGPDYALDFDGVDDYVGVPNGSAAIASQAAFSLSGWVYPRTADAASPNFEGYFGIRNSTDADFYLIQEGTNIRGGFTNSGAGNFNVATPVTVGAWQHLALVYDGANLTLYKNGEQVSQSAASGQITNAAISLELGRLMDGASQYYLDGQVDEVQLWSKALSAQEIRENMVQTLQGNETNLAAYYRFDQTNATGQTVLYDVTAANLDGALTNMDATTDWVASTAFNTWIGADSTDWGTTGNWSRLALPAAGESAGIFGGSLANNPVLSTAASLSNLVVAGGGVLSMTGTGSVTPTNNVFNYGTLTGTLSQVQAVNAAPVAFLDVTGYSGILLDPGADNLGAVTVNIQVGQECAAGGGTVRYCYDILPASQPTGANATVTFYFDDNVLNGNTCSTLGLYHYSGGWTPVPLDAGYGVDGRDCASTPRSVRATGISSFSPFVLKSDSAPTAVVLTSFDARKTGQNWGFVIGLAAIAALGTLTWRLARRRAEAG